MLKNFLRVILTIVGVAIGPGLVLLVTQVLREINGGAFQLDPMISLAIFIISGIIFGIIFLLLSGRIINRMRRLVNIIEEKALQVDPRVFWFTILGLIIGFVVAGLLSLAINSVPIDWMRLPINIISYLLCASIGARVVPRVMEANGDKFFTRFRGSRKEKKVEKNLLMPKVLDTSVIIDGRVFDICKTGIIEGKIVIPEFVLGELRHIADSADSLKRTKGRRGLDILNKIQKELNMTVEITDVDYEDMEVDAKLLKLTKELGGKVITNDFNLNKVAAVQGVPVLNINDLSNAVKPVLLPGEELVITIIKEGKDYTQGVAYLDDGTMIVVENGGDKIGKTLKVAVTSVLQTSAGRMIFVKPV